MKWQLSEDIFQTILLTQDSISGPQHPLTERSVPDNESGQGWWSHFHYTSDLSFFARAPSTCKGQKRHVNMFNISMLGPHSTAHVLGSRTKFTRAFSCPYAYVSDSGSSNSPSEQKLLPKPEVPMEICDVLFDPVLTLQTYDNCIAIYSRPLSPNGMA